MTTPPHIPIRFDALLNRYTLIILLLGIAGALYLVSSNAHRCADICREKGFADFRYQPAGRYSHSNGSCYCLTAEEASLHNRVAPGTQVPMP